MLITFEVRGQRNAYYGVRDWQVDADGLRLFFPPDAGCVADSELLVQDATVLAAEDSRAFADSRYLQESVTSYKTLDDTTVRIFPSSTFPELYDVEQEETNAEHRQFER